MQPISTAFQEKLNESNLNLCWVWRIERADNTILTFTSHNQDLIIDGETYTGVTGFDPTATRSEQGRGVRDQTLNAILDSSQITERDLLAGKYQFARIGAYIVDWLDLPANFTADVDRNYFVAYVGFITQVTVGDRGAEIEVKGSEEFLNSRLGERTSKTCRVRVFGDSRCGVDLAPYTFNVTVTAVSSRRVFSTSQTAADNTFAYGQITFTSGDNIGVTRDIAVSTGAQLTTWEQLPFALSVGDEATLIQGCDRTKFSCQRYNNTKNFRGEPFTPLEDRAINGRVRD